MQQTLFQATDRPAVIVYTDGGCDPNPGPGGWAAILRYEDHEVVLSGNALDSTNNRMEIEAAIAALAYLAGRHGSCQVDLHTDSRYLRQGITGWVEDWYANGWKTKGGQPVKNQGLWQRLYELAHSHHVSWHWVRGHAGDPLNERADQLAQTARARLTTPASPGANAEVAAVDSAGPPVELSIGVSCLSANGPGAWAVVVREGASRTVLHGQRMEATSNALYLEAALQGLCAVPERRPVTVSAAGDYLIRGASEWAPRWQRGGWRTRGGAEVQNREAWEALLEAAGSRRVTWQFAKGASQEEDILEAKRIASREAARLAGQAGSDLAQ